MPPARRRTGGSVRHPNSLANLTTNAPPAPLGNQRRRTHGAYAVIAKAELDARTAELFDAISSDAPVQVNGGLPVHDAIAVRMLAEILIRRERVRAEEIAHGLEIASGPRKGELRGIVQYGLQLDKQAMELLDRLGMTPAARARLGLTLAQARRTLEEEVAANAGAWDEDVIDASTEASCSQ